MMSKQDIKLSEMVKIRIEAYPSPGEINSQLDDPTAAIKRVLNHYKDDAITTVLASSLKTGALT